MDDFECPKGFVNEDVASQLCLEDLNEDSELWLIRIPSHVDPTTLDNQEIDLNKQLNILSSESKYYECISEKCEMSSLSLVVPQKESKKLKRAKKSFKGSIFLYDMPLEVAPEVKVEENEEADVNFVKPKSKKHKARNGEIDLNSTLDSTIDDSEPVSNSKKKSHKKKKSSVKLEPSSD